ncbi:hypothetical protein Nstercoris_02019 [Nitrosomonas stercoris]|uniref:Peptidoglycan binding-like domain-containing protein n=1 Tax=Nitrosomonas stercoris TaxID=1444684 RepID=A0A4Y1YRS2_9PROT|nr:hypothetical protein Nstercoris_02019 [Nitrosomonas stercoris]
MSGINFGYVIKSALVLTLAGAIVSCGERAEESTEQNQPEEITQSSEDHADLTASERIGIAEAEETIVTEPAEPEVDLGESMEESLESILARADEIIQRTESSLDKSSDEVKQELEEIAEDATEKDDDVSDETFGIDEAVQKAIDDRKLEVVKASPDLIRKIQQALQDAGLNPGPADGMMGPRTKNALAEFQNQHNLATSGITRETLHELNINF